MYSSAEVGVSVRVKSESDDKGEEQGQGAGSAFGGFSASCTPCSVVMGCVDTPVQGNLRSIVLKGIQLQSGQPLEGQPLAHNANCSLRINTLVISGRCRLGNCNTSPIRSLPTYLLRPQGKRCTACVETNRLSSRRWKSLITRLQYGYATIRK